ncbi:hypothetical protein L227DRAFT_265203 [Lentinus tigrinus ALCF2SS1-6]|uniref:Uncharacterized protein n=1 Tax=Lentinus tigrinus ALCF2SS1-6 TaxID=1328759 RepID=A0A5C2STP6_9APHY|nr:hypothetical protein L227DRAFT_265203 [Lentinus tigrinus ALCF2SS1-6]
MRSVMEACDGVGRAVEDVLVIRPEYEFLRETLETGYLQEDDAVVVTGQPGIDGLPPLPSESAVPSPAETSHGDPTVLSLANLTLYSMTTARHG